MNLNTWRESAEMISAPSCAAMRRETDVLPDAVGPTRTGTRRKGSRAAVTSRTGSLPPFLPDERNKFEPRNHAGLVAVLRPGHDMKVLDIQIADREHEPAAVGQLFQERLGNVGRAGCHKHAIERGELLPSDRAVAAFRSEVIPEFFDDPPRAGQERHVPLDGEDPRSHLGQDRRLVPRPGPYLQHLLPFPEIEALRHERDRRVG